MSIKLKDKTSIDSDLLDGKDSTQFASTAIATTSSNGLMSTSMVSKLNGIASNANNYVHPTSSGNKHIPSGGSSGQVLQWSSSGTAIWADPSGGGASGLLDGGSHGSLIGINADQNTVLGDNSLSLGMMSKATGNNAMALGYAVTASEEAAFAEGNFTVASGRDSHAEGNGTMASGDSSHAEGVSTQATKYCAHAEGFSSKAIGMRSHAEGQSTTASGDNAHAEGKSTTASGESSHAEGELSNASGKCAHAEGARAKATQYCTHAEGYMTEANGLYSHAQGSGCRAYGKYSFAAGEYTDAHSYLLHTEGRFNNRSNASADAFSATSSAFIIGGGQSSTATSNVFRVAFNGNVYAKVYNTSGADYAEYFEWKDGNPNNEDRIGYFVTLDEDKIRIANSDDDYIVGIVSGNQSIIGNASEDNWHNMYETDEFGRLQYEDIEVYREEMILNEETNEYEAKMIRTIENHIKLNPNYDTSVEYIPRSERKEWAVVGMLGQIIVRDDGTCKVNEYCKPSENGIATYTNDRSYYRVIKRISDNLIKVIVK